MDLLGEEFALQVYEGSDVKAVRGSMTGDIQCSCFPVRIDPGGGTDALEVERYSLSGSSAGCAMLVRYTRPALVFVSLSRESLGGPTRQKVSQSRGTVLLEQQQAKAGRGVGMNITKLYSLVG